MKNQDESKLQQACVKWFRYAYPNVLIFAIPNGGKRGVITASIMKAEGVVAGVPDLFVAHTKTRTEINDYMADGRVIKTTIIDTVIPGLFIEMKTPKGTISQAQKEIHAKLRDSGYKVEVCRTFDEFQETVNNYLK